MRAAAVRPAAPAASRAVTAGAAAGQPPGGRTARRGRPGRTVAAR